MQEVTEHSSSLATFSIPGIKSCAGVSRLHSEAAGTCVPGISSFTSLKLLIDDTKINKQKSIK